MTGHGYAQVTGPRSAVSTAGGLRDTEVDHPALRQSRQRERGARILKHVYKSARQCIAMSNAGA